MAIDFINQENILEIGKCSYTEGGTDDCSDGYLNRILSSSWVWAPSNSYSTKVNEDYLLDGTIISPPTYRYDPLDPYGPELDSRISDKCSDVNDVLVCPAAVEVSFFNIVNFVVAVALLILIYYIIYSLKKKNKKTAKKPPVKKKNYSKERSKKR